MVGGEGWLFFVLWTTFFFSHLLFLAYNGSSLPWPDTIRDCGAGGGGAWCAVSCRLFSVRKMSAQTWKLQRSRRLSVCGRGSRRVESVPARCASGISPQKLTQDAAVTPAGQIDASSAVTVAQRHSRGTFSRRWRIWIRARARARVCVCNL